MVQKLIEFYGLESHPEGGFYREIYRSKDIIKSNTSLDNFPNGRPYSTSIYYLLPKDSISRFHRIRSDEVWHFYSGGALTVVWITDDGVFERTVLGSDIDSGQVYQHVVPAGCWFAAHPNDGVEYSFVGCTVSPGFDFRDFEIADRNELLKLYPHERTIIERLT